MKCKRRATGDCRATLATTQLYGRQKTRACNSLMSSLVALASNHALSLVVRLVPSFTSTVACFCLCLSEFACARTTFCPQLRTPIDGFELRTQLSLASRPRSKCLRQRHLARLDLARPDPNRLMIIGADERCSSPWGTVTRKQRAS